MSSSPSTDDLFEFLTSEDWKTTFSSSVLTAGYKIARAKQVVRCHAERLDTGDVEIISSIIDRAGHQDESTIAIWEEDDRFQIDTSCSCSVGLCCMHSAAVMEHLARPGRLEKAFGEMAQEPPAKTLTEPDIASQPATDKTPDQPTFHLHIQRRPEGESYLWLPEVYASAFASYPSGKYPLDHTGNISKPRSRAAELSALNILYALDLMPGAEQPPPSLKKLSAPTSEGPLWAPNQKEWQPSIYWQRFHHEAIASLEKRGWQVTIAHNAAQQPLKFNASSWRAEMIDEGKGWFSLSAGFEIDGEQMDLQPILATLVEYDFLELTKDLPKGQEFLIFLPDGRALTLPIGRFRNILTHLGALLDFKFDGRPIKLHKLDATALSETLAEDDAAFTPPAEVAELAIAIKTPALAKTPLPTTLKATLRDYQHEGFDWMQFLANNQLHGILADDMGLGKPCRPSPTSSLRKKRETPCLTSSLPPPVSSRTGSAKPQNSPHHSRSPFSKEATAISDLQN